MTVCLHYLEALGEILVHADVFWVFASPRVIGENVMLTVATSSVLSGPTRLLFPRGAGSVGEASSFPFSLLGASICSVTVFPHADGNALHELHLRYCLRHCQPLEWNTYRAQF